MDREGILASDSVKEGDMSMLVVGFATRLPKRVMNLEDEPTPIPNGKHPKRSLPDEEVEKDWAVIPMDSSDRASND